ncbi:MAG: cytochrome d ubiquinol oxidase subunit II, partial [Hyphomonadaceae bacterium]|nr:cytochrome d ubiquinol oxidase subunit II [Hyphomonadaceae bacterium]
ATVAQGFILGGFIKGITVDGRVFAGGAFDWLSPFSILVAISLLLGYVLLGACWLFLKTGGETQEFSRKWAKRALIGVLVAMGAVSLATLSIDPRVTERWGVSMTSVDFGTFWYLVPIPTLAGVLIYMLWKDLSNRTLKPEWRPYLLTVGIFLAGYTGFAVSLFPYLVPFEITLWDAAARDNALGLMLVGAVIMLPTILIYTAYVYKLFWGKVNLEDGYHG